MMGVAMPGNGPAHLRHHAEVEEIVKGFQRLRGRRAEIEHHQPATRPQDAPELAQRLAAVGNVAQSEANRDDVERRIREL